LANHGPSQRIGLIWAIEKDRPGTVDHFDLDCVTWHEHV
jgi:hypothetical protein